MIFLMENSAIYKFLNMTAWRMDAPELFGGFHIAAALIAAAAAIAAAVFFSRRAETEHYVRKVLSVTGWILVLLEVYKQFFLYYIVNGGAYDWWYFPFQLCSVPMYLCVMLPVFRYFARVKIVTFLGGYTFVSAAAALIFPEDILRPYITLTVHGFLWHGLLLFISLFILLCGCNDTSVRGLLKASRLFAILSFIAICINVVVEPIMPVIRSMHQAVTHDWAAMFYLNPFHLSPQPLVGDIQKAAGIPAGLVLYALAVIAAGSIVILCFKAVPRLVYDEDEEES